MFTHPLKNSPEHLVDACGISASARSWPLGAPMIQGCLGGEEGKEVGVLGAPLPHLGSWEAYSRKGASVTSSLYNTEMTGKDKS